MENSKKISIILVCVTIVVIVVATIIKVYSNHKENLLRVANQKIAEAGEKCVLDGTCIETAFTLGVLIENGYIDEVVHPLTKEYISDSTIIKCENYRCSSHVD